MEKIKSARELALERAVELSKGLADQTRPEPYAQYVRAAALLAGSYLESKISLKQLKESINGYPAAAIPAAQKAVLVTLTNNLNPDISEPVLDAYMVFKPQAYDDKPLEALKDFHRFYTDQREFLRAEFEKGKALLTLNDDGIGGSAIAAVNPERLPQWREEKESLYEKGGNILQPIKQDLLEYLR